MDVQSDHGLLVVSLDNCLTNDTPTCDLSKANSCIYTASVSGGICGHETSVVQLAAPVQCLSDIRQSFPRVQQQHLTSLQPIQYSQAVGYETSQELQTTNLISSHPLYQPMNVSTTPIHYTTASPYLAPTLPILTPSVPLDDLTLVEPSEGGATTLAEPTYPAEGFDYFMEIQNYLVSEQYPPGVSKDYIRCLKKRALNYMMVDGKLFLNRKQPKEVIMRKDQQEDMLTDIHIVKENGIHLGVKKMFNKLHLKYFWRGMYNDVVSFVRKCEKCSDQQVVSSAREVKTGRESESEESEDVDDAGLVYPDSSQGEGRTTSRVWRKVEVQIHGPYKKTLGNNELILTMADPESKWCCAKSVPSMELPINLAEFVFQCFCNYGFARCSIFNCAPELVIAVNEEYSAKVSRLGEAFASSVISHAATQHCTCDWLHPLLDRLTQAHPHKWDKYLDQFLFQYRIGELKELSGMSIEPPFSLLFNHSPLSFTLPDEDKENVDNNSGNNSNYGLRQRRPHIRRIQCKQCQVSFTSKISFRIHQRKHISESGHRKSALQQKKHGKLKQETNSRSTQPNIVPSEALRESTVTAVKALLEATKEERRRRGKYHKFSVELHEEMAIYAMQHGNAQAVRHFTEKLGTSVSESTIRNLVKIHNTFTPAMKSEIGRFASIYGVDSATKSFSEWLKRDISPNVVRKFKIMYLNKKSDCCKIQRDRSKIGKRNAKPCEDFRSRRIFYTSRIKDEIGEYACSHTVAETMEHFSKKLQMIVKERSVKRFYKAYVDKFIVQNDEKTNENIQVEPINVVSQANEVNVFNYHQVQSLPVTLYQVNQLSTSNSTVCYQTSASSSLITSQGNGSLNYQTVQNFTTSLPSVPPPSYPVAILASKTPTQDQQSQACIIPHHSLLLTQDRENPLISHFMATAQPMQQTILTLLPEKEPTKQEETLSTVSREDLSESLSSEGATNVQGAQFVGVESKEEVDLESDNTDTAENEALEPTRKKRQRKKADQRSKKRGSYTAYSPEIRAEIGKYAAEHGSIKACQHFAGILGHEVPESTVRGLRDKYLKKKKHCQVTSLGYSQRGRPLRLGKYDEVVQDCLRDLVRSGEKVSSFLAITTAKEILNKYEPSLLEENGGSIKLNVTWAKSFLKRIGVHNNS